MSVNVHPIIAQALAPFAPQPQQHRATVGWRRTFLSRNDADQYERGYLLWPHDMPSQQALSTPFSQGWFDAERDRELADDERADRAYEARQA